MLKRIPAIVALLLVPMAEPAGAAEVFSVEREAGEVLVFKEVSTGNVTPVRRLVTGLALPRGPAVDVERRELFLADIASVEVFPLDADGEVVRLRRLNVFQPRWLAVDPRHDELYVLSGERRIEVYSRTAQGSVTPKRVLEGSETGIQTTAALFIDTIHDEVFVTDWTAGQVLVFDRLASGNVPPKRVLAGPATGLDLVRGVFIDFGRDELYLSQQSKVLVFPRGAGGDVPPLRVLRGREEASYRTVALSAAGEIWVQDYNNGAIDVYPMGAQGTIAPLRRLEGPATGMEPFPGGMALERALGGASGYAGPAPCRLGPNSLCLTGERFQVRAHWETPAGVSGEANAVPLTGRAGYFWFFGPNNVELVVKVLDACGMEGFNNFWVFAAGLTDLRVEIEVIDTVTGASWFYVNPQGVPFQSVQDTDAFATCGAGAATASAPSTPMPKSVLALNQNRFDVSVTWRTAEGETGPGTGVKLTGDAGYFSFFEPSNIELLIKVLDACEVPGFNTFWVFVAGLTDVEVEGLVVDTGSGATFEFGNPLGVPFQPVQVTDAFTTCP